MPSLKTTSRLIIGGLICLTTALCLIPIILFGITGEKVGTFLPRQMEKKVVRYNHIVDLYTASKPDHKFNEISGTYRYDNEVSRTLPKSKKAGSKPPFPLAYSSPKDYTHETLIQNTTRIVKEIEYNTRETIRVRIDLSKGRLSNNVNQDFNVFSQSSRQVKNQAECGRFSKYASGTCTDYFALDGICILIDPKTLNFQTYRSVIDNIDFDGPTPQKQQQKSSTKKNTMNPSTHGCYMNALGAFPVASYQVIDYNKYVKESSKNNNSTVPYPLAIKYVSIQEPLDPSLFYAYDFFAAAGDFISNLIAVARESLMMVGIAISLFVLLCIALCVLDVCYCCTCCMSDDKSGYSNVDNQTNGYEI